jgi:hypothetical protein
MNERIKYMAIQAGFELDVHGSNDGNFYGYDGRWINQDINRLVELAIKESIQVMVEHDYHGAWLGEKLKEHFGISS